MPRPCHRSRLLNPRSPAPCTRVVALLLLCLAPVAARAQTQSPAEQALLTGRIADAEHLLRDAIKAGDQPADHLLLCRALYAEDHFDDALPECQAAADANPTSSLAFLWLGRVQGARASHANPLFAFGIARKVRAAFARAVDLDPSSAPAIGDLGEYFVEAPAIVGGGLDQARTLAADSMSRAPSEAHRVLAMAARHSGDMALAEREFQAAVTAAHPAERPGALIDLARFLAEQDRPDNARTALRSAIAADTTHDAVLVDAARLLVRLHQPPAAAIPLLRLYLASPAQTDAAPAFKVHRELANLLDQTGDHAAADRERATAHALAPAFQPRHHARRTDDPTGQVR